MTRKTQILLVTHLFALTLGYGVVRKAAAYADAKHAGAPEYTKLAARGPQSPSGDGDELLADFVAERSGMHAKFQELKGSLPAAKDLRGAVVSAVQGLAGADWRDGLTDDEQEARLAEVEVRVWHWMKENPVEAVSFVMNDPTCEAAGLPALLKPVFREIASENGVLKSAGWLVKSEVMFGTLCELTLDEMYAGGGFTLFEKVDGTIFRSPNRSEFRTFRAQPLVSDNPAYNGGHYLRLVGGATRFEEKEKLLERVKRMRADGDKVELLSGFAASGGPAAEWVLGMLRRGELKGMVAEEQQPDLKRVVLGVAALDIDQRLEILRAEADSEGKSRQELVNELVAADVTRLLEDGRDWRFEFRSDTVLLGEVVAAVRAGLPALPEAGEEALRVTLYHQLAEENPKKALPLLDGFPVAKRREILLESTWMSHSNASPDDFLRFLADVPDAATPEEQESKLKGWNIKARGNLWRYGDDYVEWVKKMPPGIHREAAINSVIWATSEQNPAQARLLSEQFYPKKP
ncbi:MAG: hypothetical protein V4819_22585 [Verrucomicrobiota bacterium]